MTRISSTTALLLVSITLSFAQEQSRQATDTVSEKSVRLLVSMPYVNNLVVKKTYGVGSGAGFLGFSLGGEYLPSSTSSFSFQLGAAISFPLPIPVATDLSEDYNAYSSLFVNVCYNRIGHPFTYGVGIHYSLLEWERDPQNKSHTGGELRSNRGIGPAGRIHYEIPDGSLGLLYQPMVLQFGGGSVFTYQHLLSLELLATVDLF